MYTYDILAASPCCQVGIDTLERVARELRLLPPGECRGGRAAPSFVQERARKIASGSTTSSPSPGMMANLPWFDEAIAGILYGHCGGVL